MRKFMITLAAAASALAVASPAAAQYYPAPAYPAPQAYGYNGYSNSGYGNSGYGYNGANAYGYNNGYGAIRGLQVRIDQIQGRLDQLAQRRMISRGEYKGLHRETHQIEDRLRAVARFGLDPRERYDMERRIARLEQHVHREVRDGRRGGYNDYHGSAGTNAYDRDRDGRDDRYEDDRGHDHD